MIEERDSSREGHNHLCTEEIKSLVPGRKRRMKVTAGAQASAFSTAFLVLMAERVF
jgi:hypothetical protein